MNVNSNVPPPPPLYLFDLNLVGKHFDNNNPGNISIGLLSTQNKIYILQSSATYLDRKILLILNRNIIRHIFLFKIFCNNNKRY